MDIDERPPLNTPSVTNHSLTFASMSSTPLTDALPYYDTELDEQPNIRSKVEAEINAEKERMRKQDGLKDSLEEMVKAGRVVDEFHLFKDSPNLKALFTSAAKGEKLNAIDTKRYQMAAPEAGLQATEEEWDASIRNAQAQLSWADGRSTNLELMRRYGANSWRLQNYLLETAVAHQTASVQALKSETSSLHRDRRNAQQAAGHKLSSLEKNFGSLISKNLEIQVANLGMENKVEELEKRKDTLKRKLRQLEEEEAN